MFSLLLAVALASWFALLYPVAVGRLAVDVAPQATPSAVPIALVAVFAFTPLIFTVEREDGTAVLQQGLSASNILEVAITGVVGLYVAYRIMRNRRLALLPFAMPYLPFTLMILYDGLSAAWSIVPAYTLFRTVELATVTLATIFIWVSVLGALPTVGRNRKRPVAGGLVTEGRFDLAVARLRNRLGWSLQGRAANTVLVTATDRRSGQALPALKLAAIAAADRDRTLLIDADPDSTLAKDLALAEAPSQTRADDWRMVLRETRVLYSPGLQFVTLGRLSANPGARAMADAIFDRATAFDTVVINASPIGGDLITDRLTGDPRLSSILMAVSATRSRFSAIRSGSSQLARDRPVAAVLTDVPASEV